MEIKSATFVISASDPKKCPEPVYPEFAFIGRSNVGKSSLLNMLVNVKGLAKTSSKPGKTQLINHFLVNEQWYMVDLPGYGFAKVSKTTREKWRRMIAAYLNYRSNLVCVFVLVDSRIPFQANDEEMISWLGENQVPFCIVYTKADKVKQNAFSTHMKTLTDGLKKNWETLPPIFVTSSETKAGREELLGFIDETRGVFPSGT